MFGPQAHVVHEEVLEALNDMKLRRKFHYVIFKISDDEKQVVLERAREKKSGEEPDDIYDEFCTHLPPDDCRYAVYDFSIEKTYAELNETGDDLVYLVW